MRYLAVFEVIDHSCESWSFLVESACPVCVEDVVGTVSVCEFCLLVFERVLVSV